MDGPVYKIIAVLHSCAEAQSSAEKYDCRLYSYRGEDLYGFTSKMSGKYQAVAALGDILKIKLEHITAFGDDENDYEVLKYCGKGVAVANAVSMIKEITDDITKSNNNDGVAKFLVKEFKIII